MFLAQSNTEFTYEQPGAGSVVGGLVVLLFNLAIIVVMVAAIWKVFTKAGKPGWAAIIPIYNIIVLLEIIGRPVWWFIMFLIPFVNIIFGIISSIDLAKSFGKGTGFAVGLILLGPIFWLILAFGDAKYQGPAAAQA